MFRISKIDAFAVALPLTAPIKLSTITIPHTDNLIVRIADDRGRTGWGEASSAPMMTGEASAGMIAAVRFMAKNLEGRAVEHAATLPDLIEPLIYGNHAAKSAVAVVDGHIVTPEVPGLGVSVDEDKLARYRSD